jgi:hypothetical protein
MAKIPLETKMRAMTMYAHGKSMRTIAAEIDVALSTLAEWKRKNEPEDWEQFAKDVLRDVLEAARQKIRLDASAELSNHWTDTKRQRQIARALMARFSQKLGGKNEQTGEEIEMSIELPDAMIGGQRLVTMFAGIGDQQSSLAGWPNLRLDSNAPRTPMGGVFEGVNVDSMDERELIMSMLGHFAKPDSPKE